MTPLKAIRAKCLDCCCWQAAEVRACTVEMCALHPFRMGKNPNRTGIGSKTPSFGKNIDSANDLDNANALSG